MILGLNPRELVARLGIEVDGARKAEVASRIGTQGCTMKAANIRAHGGTRALNEVRMTDDGKGRKTPKMFWNIEIGIIIEPVSPGLSLELVEPLGAMEI